MSIDKDSFTQTANLFRFKAGGGGSDFRRFVYYPSLLIQGLESVGANIWLGEGMGHRSFTSLLERKSDGLHNAFLIIVSDIGFIGVAILLHGWILLSVKNYSFDTFMKFFVLFTSIAFTPVLFGMPGILIALRYIGSVELRK